MMWGLTGVAVLTLAWAVREVVVGNGPTAIIFFTIAVVLAYQGWSSYTTRIAIVRVDARGIARKGGRGWSLPWSKISAVEIDDFNGRDYLVVLRQDAKAPSHASSAYLWGSHFPKNALVSPIPSLLKDDIAGVVENYHKR